MKLGGVDNNCSTADSSGISCNFRRSKRGEPQDGEKFAFTDITLRMSKMVFKKWDRDLYRLHYVQQCFNFASASL